MRGRVDGLIVLSPHLDSAHLAANLAGRLPVLLMNGGANDAGRPSMVVDNVGGAVAAVEHLLALGHRRIAHIGGPTGNLEARERHEGYVQAMARAGQTPQVVPGDFTRASGHVAATALLAEGVRPEAIFAANDMMAVGALVSLQEAGVRCPEDVALVGFDDVPIAGLVRPALTTLRIDIAETGRRAMERLVGLIATAANPAAAPDDACEVVRPQRVIRQSTGGVASPDPTSPARARAPIASIGE
jgi:LacI family transcriptional regulator